MIHLNRGFTSYSDAGFANKAELISDTMTGDSTWVSIKATINAVPPLTAGLRDAINSSDAGRALAIQSARGDLSDALGALATAAEGVTDVTDAELASTNFDVAKTPTASGVPDAPTNVHLKHGQNPGDVIVLCAAVIAAGVRMYELEWTLDPNAGPWQDGGSFTSSRKMVLTGMPRGKDIWVRVHVLATGGKSAWSDPATIMAT